MQSELLHNKTLHAALLNPKQPSLVIFEYIIQRNNILVHKLELMSDVWVISLSSSLNKILRLVRYISFFK